MQLMKQPIRVLYVLNSPGGGATQGILELLSALPADQYEAYAVAPSEPDEFQRQTLSRLTRAFRVVPSGWWNRRIGLSLANRLAAWGASNYRTCFRVRSVSTLVGLIKEWKIDLVYTSTAMMLDGALAARLTGRPHLWHIKEWVGRQARTQFLLPDAILARTFDVLSDRVLVMSRFIGELFERNGVTRRLDVVNDGVDSAQFTSEARGHELRRVLGVADDEVLVAMSASLASTWKKHGLFIEMAARLSSRHPRARFAVFGPEPTRQVKAIYNQPWEYYQGLKRQADGLGLNGQLKWAGFWRDIPQMMNAIDILVHTCDIEPFGRVAIEAMAAGRPVVGPNRGGISESVAAGKTGLLVPPENVDAFADATSQLINDTGLREQLGVAGRHRVEEHFSIERHVRQMTSIYEQVLK